MDINLRERSRISIYDFVLEESEGVGISKNKELFLYNTESQTLRKLNDKGVIMFTSDPLFTSGEIKIYPKWIKDTGNNIFMISDSQVYIALCISLLASILAVRLGTTLYA